MNPELAQIVAIFRTGWKPRFGLRPAPGFPGIPNGGEGLIWPFSLAFGHTPAVCALERMTIERLMLALVVAAAAVPR